MPTLLTTAALVLTSLYSAQDLPLTADPAAAHWRPVKPVVIETDYNGKPVPGHRMEVRSRWTRTHLYLLYVNKYENLHLTAHPTTTAETPKLWDWDVSEAFIGSDFQDITKYKEFQVSPQGEWIDLDIDSSDMTKNGAVWSSGFEVKARIDRANKLWYGEMKIPFTSIGAAPADGKEYRLGLFRLEGAAPNRTFLSWQATNGKTFHRPEKFGILKLGKN